MSVKTRWVLLALPTILVALIVLVLLSWHLPTHIRAALTVDRVIFDVGGDDKFTILDSVGLKSIIIEKFTDIKLKPESMTAVTPSKRAGTDTRSDAPATALSINQLPVVINAKDERYQSSVTLTEAEAGQRALLTMDALRANSSSQITLENTEDADDLIVRLDRQQSSGKITVAEAVKLETNQCEITGINGLNSDKDLRVNAKLLRDSGIEFNGQPKSLVLTITVPTEKVTSLFPQGSIPITAIKLERLDGQSGRIVSSLVKNKQSEITYPDYEDRKVIVDNPDFLSLDEFQQFSVEEITFNPDHQGISLTLQGFAGKITSGSADFKRDHRLTVYDVVWHNHRVAALFAALCWMVGTTGGLYRFFAERKK